MNKAERSLTECYVSFIDLMGVRNLVKAASNDANLLGDVIAALEETKNISTFFRDSRNIETGEVKRWSLQVQAFSDCVVLFIPVESKMLTWLLASIRRLHDRLIRLKVPMRGGITIGEMHWDSSWSNGGDDKHKKSAPVAFGQGLVSAFDLENATAVYPRVLISSALYDHTDKYLTTGSIFPLGEGRLLDYFRQDADGLYHLDVLHIDLNRKDVVKQTKSIDEQGRHVIQNEFDETSYADYLEIVRQFIESGIATVEGEKLEAKYMWLANYYNEKAKQASGTLIRWFENLIPTGAIRMTMRQKSNDK